MKIIKTEIVMLKSQRKSALFDYAGKAGNITSDENMKSKSTTRLSRVIRDQQGRGWPDPRHTGKPVLDSSRVP